MKGMGLPLSLIHIYLNVHRLFELRDSTVLELLARCDAFRKPERIAQLVLVCEADKRGRASMADSDYPQGPELQRLHAAALAVNCLLYTSRCV